VSSPSRPEEKATAGIGTLTELLAGEPNVAQLVLVEIRVGGMACRDAQQRWLVRLEALVEELRPAPTQAWASAAGLTVGALNTILALEVIADRASDLPGMLEELVDVTWLGCSGHGAMVSPSP
jgi:hypothetical protein